MLNRTAYKDLLEWKQAGEGKALLVDGARQIGKTYLIEHFAQEQYDSYVKVDFLENDEAAALLSSARSAQQVIETLSLISGKTIVPGETLVFFDEVQCAPSLLTLSKYLVQDGRFPLVMSGSMLGIELKHVKSFPVGFLKILKMHPLSFSEFCAAHKVPGSVLDSVRRSFEELVPLEDAVHERLVQLFRMYLVIGGMPEVVQKHIDSKGDMGAAREIQEQLVQLYKEDISKYAGGRTLQVKAIYDALPSQLDKENKRFQLKSLGSEAKFERFANDFAWLADACAALKTTNITDPKPMLERSEEANRFKLYASDVGMLMSRYRGNVALSALAGAKSVNFGGVYENAVAQELEAVGVPLHYYHNTRNGEVDFIVETDDGVLPIEVKSGKDYKRHVALNNLMGNAEYGINEAYVVSEANVSQEGRDSGTVTYLPLYMLPFIAERAKGKGLAGVNVSAPVW